MENLKVKINSESESKEVQELFSKLGYMVVNNIDCEKGYVVASKNAESPINFDYWYDVKNIVTTPQLRDMVVLKRNSLDDATHTSGNYQYYLTDSELFEYRFGKWVNVGEFVDGIVFEPIKKPMSETEYLMQGKNGERLMDSVGQLKHSHYKKDVSHLNTLDIYRITELFKPHSCGAHIAKKALCSGERGHKDLLTDIQDIIDTAERWKQMIIEDSNGNS